MKNLNIGVTNRLLWEDKTLPPSSEKRFAPGTANIIMALYLFECHDSCIYNEHCKIIWSVCKLCAFLNFLCRGTRASKMIHTIQGKVEMAYLVVLRMNWKLLTRHLKVNTTHRQTHKNKIAINNYVGYVLPINLFKITRLR